MSRERALGQDDIRRGFVWLGAASAVARVLDAGSVLVVMWFVSREQIGVATLAWSASVFLESMNGLGLNTALLQTSELTQEKLTSAFWYTMGVATSLIALVSVFSAPLASYFGQPGLAPMIIASSTKLWFVGAALVPLNQLNRAAQFERIAAISTLATLGSGILTVVLAMLGFQAWALVIGQASHGTFTMVGALLAHSFRPRGKPRLASIHDEVVFGIKAASSSVLYHFYRNADYYLLGRFLGMSAVGVYRVAFDLAMTPTLAVLQVVNRSALPVYSRLSTRPDELRAAFLWTLRSMGILVAPVTALLVFAAEDLLSWVDHGKWLDAAPMVRWLALAALMRCLAQTFPQLFHALRRPALALYDGLLTAVMLCALLYVGIRYGGERFGPIVASWSWAAVYPLTLVVLVAMARALLPLPYGALLRTLGHASGTFGVMALAHFGFQLWLRPLVPQLGAPLNIAVLVLAFVAYLRWVMRVSLKSLTGRSASTSSG
ncbi:MAG: lipopolysaccharide biosynthesis protein [Polyangiales bacterium]